MIGKNKVATAIGGALLLVAGLSGCSGSRDEAPVADNMVEENYQADEQPMPEPMPLETPTPEPLPATDLNATAEALPPASDPSADEQMADDASATGMTARASRGDPADEAPTGGNFSGQ
ncbi:hypothetical protein [Sphingomonas sp.]|uniref:hypothetical protein n=1 Tax=Sphingomonas sp. TaxID=28214 RepID=UPI0035C7CC7D